MMKTLVIALAALLSLTSAGWAAFGIFQTYQAPTVPQVFYNIVSDGGAHCSGTPVQVASTVSINTTTKVLDVTVNTFAPGDVGKAIFITGAGFSGATWNTTIASYNNAQQVVLTATFATLSSSAQTITLGFDDAPNFITFNTWARANQTGGKQVVLTIPNGSTCWFGTQQNPTGLDAPPPFNAVFAGINDLIVEGTGATFTSQYGSGFYLGARGLREVSLSHANGKSARLKSVSAGSSTLELTAASYSAGYISRFSVGAWLLVSGLNIQAQWNSSYGIPPNFQFFEYRQVTAVCNNTGPCSGTATVTLDRPLDNTYLSTWPEYYDGGGGANSMDQGGPATAYVLGGQWNAKAEYRGLTFDGGQGTPALRYITFRNVTMLGCCGQVPSQNEVFTAVNTSVPNAGGGYEVDKLITSVVLDGFSVPRIDFQSSAVGSLTISNTTIGSMFGSPINSYITDSTFGLLRPGAWAYGSSTGGFTCIRCNVADWQDNGGILQQTPSDYSMSSGVISFANTSNVGAGPPARVFVPRGNVYWANNSSTTTIGLFQSTGLTQDPTNVYVQTNEAGGFPATAGYQPYLRTHPAPIFTCTDPDPASDAEWIAICTNAGATPGAPVGQFNARYGLSPTIVNQGPQMNVRGKVVSLDINVTQAYTGSGASNLQINTGNVVRQSTWTAYTWTVTVNLKVAGRRVTTPSGTTCDTGGGPVPGGCSGDTFSTLPEPVWVATGIQPVLASTPAGGGLNAIFDVIIKTDQGVVP